ncbi:MAG: EFR1 family ferrodoxin [Ignavibacteriales bacterium]
MSDVEIYYFSGSGNSLAVARDVAQRLNAGLTSIPSLMDQESIRSDAGAIGLVFPLYDFKPPKIVEQFVSRLADIESKYIFGICTYGIAPSQGMKRLQRVIAGQGGHLSGGFAVGMPHNAIGSSAVPESEHRKMFEAWKARLPEICEYVSNRREGRLDSSVLFCTLFSLGFIRMAPSVFKFLTHVLFKGVDSLSFNTNDSCTGCGTCTRVCPMDNIEMLDHHPRWSDRCTSCFACLHWCPNGAIRPGGMDFGIRRYRHPDVTVSAMMRSEARLEPNTQG